MLKIGTKQEIKEKPNNTHYLYVNCELDEEKLKKEIRHLKSKKEEPKLIKKLEGFVGKEKETTKYFETLSKVSIKTKPSIEIELLNGNDTASKTAQRSVMNYINYLVEDFSCIKVYFNVTKNKVRIKFLVSEKDYPKIVEYLLSKLNIENKINKLNFTKDSEFNYFVKTRTETLNLYL